MKEFLYKAYSRDELLLDTKWILLFASAMYFQSGIKNAIILTAQESGFLNPEFIFMGVSGAVFFILALIPLYWFRLAVVLAWLANMIALNIFLRFSLATVFFIPLAVYYTYKMAKCAKEVPKSAQIEDAPKSINKWSLTLVFMALLVGQLWTQSAFANASEVMEIKGRGVMNVEVLSEDDKTVRLKNPAGNVETISKINILFREELRASQPKPKSRPASTAKNSSSGSKSSFEEGFKALKDPKNENAKAIQEKFKKLTGGGSGPSLDQAMILSLKDKIEQRVKNPTQGNQLLGIVGMLLMAAGGLATLFFGIKIFIFALSEGFANALWFAGIPASGFLMVSSPLYGAILAGLCSIMIIAFMIRQWTIVRKMYVPQIFAVNFVMLGVLLLI